MSDELRRDVATANRILERLGLSPAFGHASARIPGTATFLIPTRRSPGLAEADRLLTLDTEGRIAHARRGRRRCIEAARVHARGSRCIA